MQRQHAVDENGLKLGRCVNNDKYLDAHESLQNKSTF